MQKAALLCETPAPGDATCHNSSKCGLWSGPWVPKFPGAPLHTSVTQEELLFLIPTSLICQMGTVVTLSALLSYGCLNKLPQISCLNQHKHITYGSGSQKSSNRGVGSLCSFWRRWDNSFSPLFQLPGSSYCLWLEASSSIFKAFSPSLLPPSHSFSNSDLPFFLL